MRGTVLILGVAAVLLAGCAASSELQSTLGNKYRYSLSMTEPAASKELLFRDDQLIVQFRAGEPGLRFQLQNISPADLRINWAGATIDVHGVTSAVRHLATLYDTTRQAPADQVIPSLGVIRDAIVPRPACYFDGSEWQVDDLLPTLDANTHSMRGTIMRMPGTSIEVRLPITSASGSRSYRFTFVVDSVRQISWSEYRPASWIPKPPPIRLSRPTPAHQVTAVIIASSFLGFLKYIMSMKKVPVVE